MISLSVGKSELDILPVVRGLSSYAEHIDGIYGNYDRYAVSLSPEEIEGVRHRESAADNYEPSELDLVFAHRLSHFGEVTVPAPAWCAIVDLCDRNSKELIPLDMPDRQYTEIYCETVSSLEWVGEHRLAKKGMKKKFDMSSPEKFSEEWDDFINRRKGFREMSNIRERYISLRLSELSKNDEKILAVIDHERVKNILGMIS